MSFAAQSESLAILEYLVHATSEAFFEDVTLVIAQLDDRYIASLDESKLPRDWRSFPPGSETQRIGDAWLTSGASAALLVPSAIVPRERNVLVNPLHRDFGKLQILESQAWGADPRLEPLR